MPLKPLLECQGKAVTRLTATRSSPRSSSGLVLSCLYQPPTSRRWPKRDKHVPRTSAPTLGSDIWFKMPQVNHNLEPPSPTTKSPKLPSPSHLSLELYFNSPAERFTLRTTSKWSHQPKARVRPVRYRAKSSKNPMKKRTYGSQWTPWSACALQLI